MSLVCRIGEHLCAIPLEHVVETLRTLPIEPVAGAPDFVLGVTILRGGPVPVVDPARLLGGAAAAAGRLVSLRVSERRVALAVDAVVGVHDLCSSAPSELPPLLRDAAAEGLAALGCLDSELLLVLRSVAFLPKDTAPAGAGRP